MRPNRSRESGFRRVDEIAASAGAQLPRQGQGRHLLALAAWRAAVGERLDRSTRFARLADGVMTVDVAGPEWHDTLSRWSPQILERVRSRLGAEAPRRLELRIRPGLWRPPERISPAAVRGAALTDEGARTTAMAVRRDARPGTPAGGAAESRAPGMDQAAVVRSIAERYLAALALRRARSVS